MTGTIDTLAATAATQLNTTLGDGTAETVPDSEILILERDDALVTAIATLRRLASAEQLTLQPIMIWCGRNEILVGPQGTVELGHVLRGSERRDLRIYPQPGLPARVVLSWIDGPTLAEITPVIAALPHTGLDVELLREDSHALFHDVIDAVFALPNMPTVPDHPVLARVGAVRDGDDTYFELLDLTVTLTHELLTQDSGLRLSTLALAARGAETWALDEVLDDLDARMAGEEFFPVRAVDHHCLLIAVFALAVATATQLPRAARRRIRRAIAASN